ncbi:MAG: DUF4097 family beta strand repeat protein [Pyrinomonadaceae bacterium]|nr:DUF4097 family beta strand repeat protein [Pyrinomonadaceae bacterium]
MNKNKFLQNLFLIISLSLIASSFPVFAGDRSKAPEDFNCEAVENFNGFSEKAIAVSDKVNISVCVREGYIKINGWNRNEIRAFVSGGTAVGFSVLEKSKSDDHPVWVKILGYDPSVALKNKSDECVAGNVIELDVPFGATVNIKSGESKTSIDSVAKVSVKNVGGDIFLNNISTGIEARTYRGNVTVKNSGGSMTLETTNGNIVAYDASSEAIGDSFNAKTSSGAITLQKVRYRETEVNSNSGSINFAGELLKGGQYYFGSANSLITLILPENSSSKIVAVYGYGSFDSEIPMKDLVREPNSKLGSLSATLGDGDALLNFKTVTGKIIIKKQ